MRYIQHPVTFELIPADQYERLSTSDYQIMPDIQPYRSMIDGTIIHSRSQHRNHLREHGCIEVGNDSIVKNAQYKPLQSPPGLKQMIIQVANEKLRS